MTVKAIHVMADIYGETAQRYRCDCGWEGTDADMEEKHRLGSFLEWAAQAEDGRGTALSDSGYKEAVSACNSGFGELIGGGNIRVFIINKKGRAAIAKARAA